MSAVQQRKGRMEMANRQQRRMAAKKHPGENYAAVLMKQKLIRETVQQEVHSESVKLEADIKVQRFMWMAVVALNEAFGFGGERAKRFLLALEEVSNECQTMAKKHGGLYARQKLMESASKITGMKIAPVHEEEMMQARKENKAKGVYFPPDDPDEW